LTKADMFYRILPFLARMFGVWTFDLIAKGVAAGYFFFAPRRVMVSVRFYRALYPQRAGAYHFWCTWKQFQNFTSVYLDRYRFHEVGDIHFTSEGWEHVENALDRKTGGIILMSHLGNWEIAAHLMKQKREQMPLILYMGLRAKAHIERIQKEDLRRRGIRIIAVEKNGEASFDLLEGLRFIQAGGLLSMTGDQLWNSSQRAVCVSMLGHEVRLPETPHLLAMLSGAPLIVFFSRRTGKKRYHLMMTGPLHIEKAPRRLRAQAIRKSVQAYADLLETHLRGNPLEWYHFEQFLGSRLK
jgi:predicted LPLAT superfamily acyltransferase